jgi:transposase-like protein
MITGFKSLYDLFEAIPDEQAAIDHFTAVHWKNGEFCPYCGATKIYHFADKRNHKCGACRQRFSIKVGTVFEDTKIPMRKWLAAIWLITSHKKGIASTTLAKDIKVTQKTAWFMLHRLRYAARTKSFNMPLQGIVEIDETFVGGKERNKHAKKRKHLGTGGSGKAAVLGMLERSGELRTMKMESLTTKDVHGVVNEHVEAGSHIMTDEYGSYRGLQGRFLHHTINHSAGEWVRLTVIHTNSIEGVWALLKRQIYGIHHFVSVKHLGRYLAEATWRYNRRSEAEGERVDDLLAHADGRLTYKALIA